MRRRSALFYPISLLTAPAFGAAGPARGVRPRRLAFPADFGAHPDTRTEWWYMTGWLAAGDATAAGSRPDGGPFTPSPGVQPAAPPTPTHGFQLTFFRVRTGVDAGHPSRFAATQLVLAHAAVSDLDARRLRHDQRSARAVLDVAGATVGDTRTWVRDWRFERQRDDRVDGGSGSGSSGSSSSSSSGTGSGNGINGGHGHNDRGTGTGTRTDTVATASRYRASLRSDTAGFTLELDATTTQPLLLQGDAGYSRKGPDDGQASHYYSQPQLAVEGTLRLDGRARAARGRAWLDHEWSDTLLHPQAVGWDWIGINLDDGGALTAFRLRRADGGTVYAGGSLRRPGGAVRVFAPAEVRFTPLRHWTSPRTQGRYPVAWQVDTPAGRHRVEAWFDDQELDSRASTGAVYWEGLSRLSDEAAGRPAGLGYLEMTGYVGRLQL